MITRAILDWALMYAKDKKWPVFPIHWIENGKCSCGRECKSPGKHPLTKNGAKDASLCEKQITAWFKRYPKANIGIATGRRSGKFVIDVDPGRNGDVNLSALGDIPEVFHVLTGGGGEHFYIDYPTDTDIEVPCRTNLFPGIDIRGEGGYVVAPPSNHASGGVYEWEHGYSPDDDDFGELDNSLSKEFALSIGLYRKVAEKPSNSVELSQSSHGSDIGVDELEKLSAALEIINSDSRDSWLEVGMALHSTGWDNAFCIWCDWSSKSDKYDEADQYRTWNSFKPGGGLNIETVYHRANEISPGWSYGEEISFINDELPNPIKHDIINSELYDKLFFLNQDWLNDDTDKPEQLLNGDMLTAGSFTLLTGAPKTRKSFFVMELAMQAAIGGTFLNYQFSKQCKVAWFQAEIKKCHIKGRFNMAMPRFNDHEKAILSKNFLISDRLAMSIENPKHFLAMCDVIEQQRLDMLIIDPLFNFTDSDENDVVQTKKLLAQFELLKARFPNLAIIIVHHNRKSVDHDDAFASIRGSSALRGYYDLGIMLLKQSDGAIKIIFEARNSTDVDDITADFDNDTAEWKPRRFVDDSTEPTEGTKVNAVIDIMAQHGVIGLNQEEFEKAIIHVYQCSSSEAKDHRRKLINKRLIKAIGPKKARSYILAKFWSLNLENS